MRIQIQDPGIPHEHQCGLIGVDLGLRPDEIGCGHVWSHARKSEEFKSRQEYSDFHRCPKCGLGPWFTVHEPEEPAAPDPEQLTAQVLKVMDEALSQLFTGKRKP